MTLPRLKTYEVRIYVAGVHVLEVQATSVEHARACAEQAWWRGQPFHVDQVPTGPAEVVDISP
jgi:hypothetical protein